MPNSFLKNPKGALKQRALMAAWPRTDTIRRPNATRARTVLAVLQTVLESILAARAGARSIPRQQPQTDTERVEVNRT